MTDLSKEDQELVQATSEALGGRWRREHRVDGKECYRFDVTGYLILHDGGEWWRIVSEASDSAGLPTLVVSEALVKDEAMFRVEATVFQEEEELERGAWRRADR